MNYIKLFEEFIYEAKLLPGTAKIPRAEGLSMAKDIAKILGVKFVDPDEVTTETSFIKDAGIPVGSIRRGNPEVGDIDIIITAHIDTNKLKASKDITDVSGGDKQTNFIYSDGKNTRKVNLFSFTDPNTFGAALMHTTGPGNYNMRIRFLVPKRGFGKLSQLGLMDKGGKVVAGKTEGEIQRTLDITQREPNKR